MTTSGPLKWGNLVKMSGTSTGRPVSNKLVIDDDVDSDTTAESNLSLKSHSFLNRVNDRLRRMLDRSPEDSMQDIDKRSWIGWMFMSSTLEASVFMGRNYSDNLHSIKNTGNNLTLKQMFDISEQLILEQSDKIFGVSQISWESSPWKQLSLVNEKEVNSLSHAKVYVFSDSVLCLGKVNQNPTSNTVWEDKLTWFKSSSQYRTLDTIDGEPMDFEWNIFQDSLHCSSSQKSKRSWTKWVNPNNSKDELSSCRCSMTSYEELKTMKRNVLLIPHLCLYLQKDFQQDVGHSSDLDQKQSGILLKMKDLEENGTKSLNWWGSNSEKADTQFSEPRDRCLEERSKAKKVENYLYASVPMEIRLKLFFAQSFLLISSVSTEQSQNCVKSIVAVKQEQGDLLWQSDLIHIAREQIYW